jgi:O-antigen/teichoic acid export membrane protein
MLTSIAEHCYFLLKKITGKNIPQEGFIVYLRNIQWFGVARIGSLIISLAVTMLLARYLGPSDFGKINYALSIIGLFAVFVNLGIDNILYKYIIKTPHKREELLGSSIFLKSILGFLGILLVHVFIFLNQEIDLTQKILLSILSFSFITQPLTLLSFDFLKDREGKYVTITQVSSLFIASLLKLGSVLYFDSLFLFGVVVVIENILTGFFYIYQIRYIKKRTLFLSIKKETLLLFFSASLPLILFSFFNELYSKIDQVMIGNMFDSASVGIYASAVRLVEIWYMLPNILLGALFPALVNSSSVSREAYKKRFFYFFVLLTGISLTLSIIISMSSKLIIEAIYGAEFIFASEVLKVYIYSLFGSFVGSLIYQDLIIRDHKKALVIISFLTAALNILLNFLFLPSYGILGAAYATVISYTVIPCIWYLFKNKVF